MFKKHYRYTVFLLIRGLMMKKRKLFFTAGLFLLLFSFSFLGVFAAEPLDKIGFFGGDVLRVKSGESLDAQIIIRNDGDKFVNDCYLTFQGLAGRWIVSDKRSGISAGEKLSYPLAISIPQDAQDGTYFYDLFLLCDEGEFHAKRQLEVFHEDISVSFLDYKIDSGEIFLIYEFREKAFNYRELEADYSLVNSQGAVHASGKGYVSLMPGQVRNVSFSMPLPKNSFGEFELVTNIKHDLTSFAFEDELFLPSRPLFTGYAILNSGGNSEAFFLLAIFFNMCILLLILSYRKSRRRFLKNTAYRDSSFIKQSVVGKSAFYR